MSARFAAWLRVTPAPSTLAESSAIYQALSQQGRVNVFKRASRQANQHAAGNDKSCSIYYTVFALEPPSLRMTFDVPVHHDLPSPRDEDPFNIRGLQDRKPMPAPKTFACVLERARWDEARLEQDKILKDNPFYGRFKVQKGGWAEEAVQETGAPPGIEQGAGPILMSDDVAGQNESAEGTPPAPTERASGFDMASAISMWRQRIASKQSNDTR